MADLLAVKVILLNDDGEREEQYAEGETVEGAVAIAVEAVRARTADDSYVMTDWSAA